MSEGNQKASIGKDAVILTTSRVIVALIGLITSMLLARFRTLDEYGTYSQIIMITNLVTTILLLGLPNSINYFLAKADSEEERRLFWSVYLTLTTVLTIIIAISLNIAVPLIVNYFNNPLITNFAYVFAVYPWASLIINSLSNTCIVYGKSNRLIFFNISQAIVTLLVLAITKISKLDFQWYMIMYMATLLVFAIFALGWVRKLVGKLKICFHIKLIKKIFVFSIPMGLASVVGTLNVELDKFVIGKFFSTEQYAIFANAAKELPITMLATALTAVLLPCLVRLLKQDKKEDAVKVWGYSINISLCVMCLFVGGFFVFAPDIMAILYSAKYATEGVVAVFRIYSLILLYRATYWGIVLNATGNTKFILWSSIITLCSNFVGNIVGYYCLGFIGPAISSFVVTGVMSFVQLGFTCRVLKIKTSQIFPWRNILRLLIQTTVLGIVFWIIKNYIFQPTKVTVSILISVILGVIWAILYIGINYKMIRRDWKLLNSYRNS